MIRPDLAPAAQAALRQWHEARAARGRAQNGHAWANAETAVRFWATEFRGLRAEQRRTLWSHEREAEAEVA